VKIKLEAAKKDGSIELIDELVTLKAMKKLSGMDKKLVVDMYKRNSSVIDGSITMYESYMDDLSKDSKVSDYDPTRKGYTRADEGTIKYKLVPESEVIIEMKNNLSLVGDPDKKFRLSRKTREDKAKLEGMTPYITVNGVDHYMMVGRIPDVGFSEGAIGMISTTMEGIDKVVMKGTTRSTISLKSGIHVDLRVVPSKAYGAALHHFTGSKQHNIALRKMVEIVCLNEREFIIISSPRFSNVVMAEVGATMVGSIVQTYTGSFVAKGEEKGYFKFGGSTVVLLFEKNKIRIDNDLLINTTNGFETSILAGQRIAVVSNNSVAK
jgi:hypothetical protein